IKKEIGDRRGEGLALTNIGVVYYDLGQYDKALTYYGQALAIDREIGDRRGEGSDLSNIGVVYGNLGQYDKALTYYGQALAIRKEIGDRRGEGSDLSNIGVVYGNLGQYDKALTYHGQALAIRKEIGDRRGEGSDLSNIGVVYYDLGQYDKALTYYEQALAIDREIGDRRGEGSDLTNIGVVYDNLGQYDRALTYCEQALAIRKEIGDRRGEGSDLTNIGVVYGNLGQYDRALTYCEQALAIRKEIGDRRGEGSVLTNIGVVYGNLGQYDKAEKSFAQSMRIFSEIGAPDALWVALRGLAQAEAKLKKYENAVSHYKDSLDHIEAVRKDISEKEHKTSFMRRRLYVYDEFITLLRELHQKHPAKGYDKESFKIFERKQGRIFLEQMGESGARNFGGFPDEMRKRETELANRLAKTRSGLTDERSKPSEDRNIKRIRELEAGIGEITKEETALQEKIREKHPDYYALKYPRPVSLGDLQKNVLRPGEMMLIYNVMEEITCLWIIGRETFKFYPLPITESDLSDKIAAFRKYPDAVLKEIEEKTGNARLSLIARHSLPLIRKKGKELCDLLIPEQARKHLKNARPLFIIPTGPLYDLPFEALDFKGDYLIEKHPVAYLSSASLLKILRDAQERKKADASHPLLAFANPDYGTPEPGSSTVTEMRTQSYLAALGGEFAPLPVTEEQVKKIRHIFKAGDLYLRKDASLTNVSALHRDEKLDDYRHVIFACHGVVPSGKITPVNQPALVLSHPDPVTKGEGYLKMADVFGLRLNAELVTLSACNTGRGENVRGEGVRGLTRAFMYAGTPAVAVTLWSVADRSTKDLCIGFYKYLKAGKAPICALRQIKLDMIRGEIELDTIRDEQRELYQHPFFWAPVVLWGDGQGDKERK
ncbi:CHAT domain-containing tetratricopeptide repeat protein, partial [Desulfobacterales bacterium HSG2]|nr:CHAT domain-containing tetratricopeptide repeat protein [Desulfobacterales bacterium HSG2]